MEFTESLKKNYEFRRLYSKGKSAATPYVVVYAKRTGRDVNHLGVTVSNKIGKAVVRNKVRRRLKESMRGLLQENTSHVHANMIFVARTPIVQASYSQIKKDMKYLMKKAGLFEAETADQGETK